MGFQRTCMFSVTYCTVILLTVPLVSTEAFTRAPQTNRIFLIKNDVLYPRNHCPRRILSSSKYPISAQCVNGKNKEKNKTANFKVKFISKIFSNIALCYWTISMLTVPSYASIGSQSVPPYFIDLNGKKILFENARNPAMSSPTRLLLQKKTLHPNLFLTCIGAVKGLFVFAKSLLPYVAKYCLLFLLLGTFSKFRGGVRSGAGQVGGDPVFSIATQDTLEARPYWDQSNVPVGTYSAISPCIGKVVSTKTIAETDSFGETRHIIIKHRGKFRFWEGQSVGIIPPGVCGTNQEPYSPRLYHISSSRYGDDKQRNALSICVRRVNHWCPELNHNDPAKKGICSNYLCDIKPGSEIKMTGPEGKDMIFPENNPNAEYIMIATGTGIAPFRGYIRRLFAENTRVSHAFKGHAWLFLGDQNSDSLSYYKEFQAVQRASPDKFRFDYAAPSCETKIKIGDETMNLQDKMEEYSDEIFSRLENGAHIFFCGASDMMPGIETMLQKVAESKGIDYENWITSLKSSKMWREEVYLLK